MKNYFDKTEARNKYLDYRFPGLRDKIEVGSKKTVALIVERDENRRLKQAKKKKERHELGVEMLRLYNVERRTLREIGKIYDVSGEWVRQVITPLGMIKREPQKPQDRTYICLFCGKKNHKLCLLSLKLPRYCDMECKKSHTKKKLGIDTREGVLRWQRERAQKWLLRHRDTPKYRKMVKRNNMRQTRKLRAIRFERSCDVCSDLFIANMTYPKKRTCGKRCAYMLRSQIRTKK